ncbi:MAG TPA: phosphate signaling complex protein PhoU [Trueperaceae bacterium]|nr:phosphate signaling complex protein PhoU [Trueperaceae bacterium]
MPRVDSSPLSEDIRAISNHVLRMLSLVREATELARRALIDQDEAAAERCIAGDAQIDAMQAELETRILTVIARRQPAARDLRFLGASFQALHDIERAGDYAEHVAKAALDLAKEPPLKRYLDLQRCFEVLAEMLDVTMKAYAEEDAEAAKRAHAMDQEVDDLYEQIQRELLTYMLESPAAIGRANRLLEVARYLERLGDHVENVNEHVVFWLTGERRM